MHDPRVQRAPARRGQGGPASAGVGRARAGSLVEMPQCPWSPAATRSGLRTHAGERSPRRRSGAAFQARIQAWVDREHPPVIGDESPAPARSRASSVNIGGRHDHGVRISCAEHRVLTAQDHSGDPVGSGHCGSRPSRHSPSIPGPAWPAGGNASTPPYSPTAEARRSPGTGEYGPAYRCASRMSLAGDSRAAQQFALPLWVSTSAASDRVRLTRPGDPAQTQIAASLR